MKQKLLKNLWIMSLLMGFLGRADFSIAAFSPDGKLFVEAGGSFSRIWDIEEGAVIQRLGHEGCHDPAFSEDGQYLAMNCKRVTVIWDLKGQREFKNKEHYGDDQRFLQGSHDLVTAFMNRISVLGSEGQLLKSLELEKPWIAQAISGTGRWIAFSRSGLDFFEGEILVYDVLQQKEVKRFHSDFRRLESIAFSPDERTLALSSGVTIQIRGVDGSQITQLDYIPWIDRVSFSSNGRYLLVADQDHFIRFWKTSDWTEEESLKREHRDVRGVELSPDGTRLAVTQFEDSLKLYDLVKETHHSDTIHQLAYSSDGKYLVSASKDQTLKVWEVSTGKMVRTLSGHEGPVVSVDFCSGENYRLVSGSTNEILKLWHADTGKDFGYLGRTGVINSVRFSPDGKYLVWGTSGGYVKFFSVVTQEVTMIQVPGAWYEPSQGFYHSNVRAMAFLPDPHFLAVGSDSGVWVFSVFEKEKGKLDVKQYAHYPAKGIMALAVSHDGRKIAAGDYENRLYLWDFKYGRQIYEIYGNPQVGSDGAILSLAFSADDQRLIIGEIESQVRILDTETGKFIYRLFGHSGAVTSVVVSPDGKTLASGSTDRTIKLWDLETRRRLPF